MIELLLQYIIKQIYCRKKATPKHGRYLVFKGKGNREFYLHQINLVEKKINKLTIWESNEAGEIDRIIFAKNATWTPTHWQMRNGDIRHFENGAEVGYETFEKKLIKRHEDPARFIGSDKDPRAMTIKELKEQIAYKKEAGSNLTNRTGQVASQNRISFCCGCRCHVGLTNCNPVWKSGIFCRISHCILSRIYLLGNLLRNT